MLGDDLATICANTIPDGSIASNLTIQICQSAGYAVGSAMTSTTQSCVNAGNTIVAPLDAKTNDVAANWNPPDTYTSDQIRSVTSAMGTLIQQAQSAVTQASAQPNANQTDLMNATNDLLNHAGQAQQYNDAANSADAQGNGTVVSAPNFKQWVVNAMNSSSNAMVTAYVVGCTTPWWVSVFAGFETAFDVVWGLVKSIVGAAVAVGGAVVSAAEGAATAVKWSGKILGFLVSWWPVIGLALLGGGAYLIYRHRHKFKLPKLDHLLHSGDEAEEHVG